MDKDINLSRELKTVFDLAKEDAVKNFLTEISAESVIYYIFKRYINDSDVLEITYFETFLNKYFTDNEKQDLLNDCFYCYQASMKNTQYKLDISLYNTSNVSLSSEVMEIFYRAKAAHKFSESASGISKDVIDCIEFMLSSMNSSYISTVRVLASKYGFYKKLGGYLTNMGPETKKSNKDDGKNMEELFEDILKSFGGSTVSSKSTKGEESNKDKEEDEQSQQDFDNAKDEEFEKAGESEAINAMANTIDPNSKTPNLDQYSIELTKKAKNGEYDPVIGREKEIQEIIEVLCCRKKNNVIITGCAGGGKSAIVEKLSQKIADNDVPRELRGKRIFSLDLNALVSGTQYRGQYEERLQNIIKEVVADKNLIIFIDEVHNMLGNGSSVGSGDMANILKPYLARGEFQLIGATTEDEFRKFIEKDGALKRRLTQVRISEPNLEETFEILKGISKQYSEFHRVLYTDPVLRRCVEWSDKYINDRFFPDKAIGIMDMSSSVAKLNNPIDLSAVDRLTKELEEVKNKKIEAVNDARYEEASEYRDKEKSIEEELKKETDKLESSDTATWPIVKEDDVANVISKISGVPVDKIRSTDMEKIKELKGNLKSKIIGQDEAVDKMVLALQRNILGLRDPKKPIYSALLLGPTGVGKTLTAKMIAEQFFGSEKNMELISGSEYSEAWAESKLLGSAPGYVGYSDTEPRLYILRRKPYCCLVVDEFEKFDKKLYNIWLSMLEEGEIVLSNGEKVSCRNCIILFTSNCGTKSLELQGSGIGFTEPSKEGKRKLDVDTVMREVKKEFRPEFLNRLSSIIVYNTLGKEEMDKIFDIEFAKLQVRLKENYNITVSESVKNLVIEKCDPKYGARDLQRNITKYIEEEICKAMLEEDTSGKENININYTDEKIVVKFS